MSLDSNVSELDAKEAERIKFSDLHPEERIRACGANLIVANKDYYWERLNSVAAKMGLPVLIWTPDTRRELIDFIYEPNVIIVVTNYPQTGIHLRNEIEKDNIYN